MGGTELDGATSPGEAYAESANAGEFAARWNAATEEQREKALLGIKGLTRNGARCLELDHDQEIAGLRASTQRVRIEALQEARAIILRRTGTYEADIDLLERIAELEAEARP